MTNTVFEGKQLTKKYKQFSALKNVSLIIQKGEIYGLIGQNGAGKSTLMRLIAGLTFASEGSMVLFGASTERSIQQNRRRIGCLIETSAIFPGMTATDNLAYYIRLKGISDTSVIEETLATVGLDTTGKKKAKNFSLGMKQRLGIAIALLDQPEFLILDEPINGLDPAGVVEIRNLLTKLNQEQGMTILISSHNLPELYQLATRYIIIDHGELVKTITHEELEAQSQQYLRVACSEPDRLASFITAHFPDASYQKQADNSFKVFGYGENIAEISSQLTQAGLTLTTFVQEEETLEQYFLKLIGGTQR